MRRVKENVRTKYALWNHVDEWNAKLMQDGGMQDKSLSSTCEEGLCKLR